MKRKVFFLVCIVCVVFGLASCASIKGGINDSGVTTALEPKEYEVLGPVHLEGKIINIFGLVQFGGKGYADLLSAARQAYPSADAVIDIYTDKTVSVILGVYNSIGQQYYGTAIRYK